MARALLTLIPALTLLATSGARTQTVPGGGHRRDAAPVDAVGGLKAKGYELSYREVAGGHEPVSWRGGIAEGLVQLMGR